MFKKLLCPTDFSEASYRALQWAESCARRFGSELIVVHVIPYPDSNFVASSNFEAAQAAAITSLNQFVSALNSKPEVMISAGEPWQKIIELSQNLEATAIVMGTKGLQGLTHKVLGSTTENVMRESSVPVVTLTNDSSVARLNEKKRVLLPISNLKVSIPERISIKQIIRELGSTVTLMHVVEFSDSMFERFREERPFQLVETETSVRKRQLSDRAQDLLSVSGTIRVDPSVVRFGDVSDEILNELRTERYDLLLMPVRKRNLFSRFRESIAYRVLSHSNVPVITLKRNA
jgi:nucleotide-binding universal stress UspA family protein